MRAGVLLGALVWCCITAWAEEDDPVIEEKPLSQLIKQLRSDNRGLQLRAAQALSKAPGDLHAKIVPLLIPLLKSERENDKFVAAQTLGAYGPVAKGAVPDLLPMLEGTQFERNRTAAAKALGQILIDSPPSDEIELVTKKLIAIFRDKYADVQRESVRACGMIGPAAKSCIPHLRAPLEYGIHYSSDDAPYFLVRREAAWTLSRMGPLAAEYMDRLIARLHYEGGRMPEITRAIQSIGATNANVVMNLVDSLEGWRRDWRENSAAKMAGWKALEKFGPKAAPAVPLIARFLREGRGMEEPPELPIQWFAVLRAVGPAAQQALPEVKRYADPKTIPEGWRPWAADLCKEAARTAEALSNAKPPEPQAKQQP